MADVGDVRVRLRLDTSDFTQHLTRAGEQMRQAGQQMGQAGVQAGQVFGNLRGIAVSLAAAVGGVSLARLGKSILEAGLAAQRTSNQLLAATGSSQAAAREWRFLEREADRLGLNLDTAAANFGKLAAAAGPTRLGLQGARDLFTAVAEASTVMGLSAEETGGALTALQQIISKGTVAAEELRGQLGERIPGAFQIAAQGMGLTTAQLSKMLEHGLIPMEVFLPKFAAALRQTFAEALPSATRSAQAEINRFGNAWQQVLRTLAQSGAIDGLTRGLRQLTDVLKDPAFLASLQQAGQTAGTVLSAGLGLSAAAAKRLSNNLNEAQTIWERLQWSGATIGGAVQGAASRAAQTDVQARQAGGVSGFVEGIGSALTRFSTLPALLRLMQTTREVPLKALEGSIAEDTRRRVALSQVREAEMFPPLELPPVIRASAQREQMDQLAKDLKRTFDQLAIRGPHLQGLDVAGEQAGLVKKAIEEISTIAISPEATEDLKTRDALLAQLGKQYARLAAASHAFGEAAEAEAKRYGEGLRELEERLQRLGEAQAELVSRAVTLFEAVRTPQERYAESIRQAAELLQAHLIDVEDFHRAVAQAAEQLGLPLDVKAWEQITTAMDDQVRALQAEVAAAGRTRAERTQILETERQLQQLRAQGVRDPDITPQMRTDIQAYAAEVARLQEQLRGLRDPLQEFLEASESGWVKLRQGALDAIGSLEEALVDFWTTGKFNVSDFANSIQRDLLRAFTRSLITEPLVESLKGVFDVAQGTRAPGEVGGTAAGLGGALGRVAVAFGLKRLTPAAGEATRVAALQPLTTAGTSLSAAATQLSTAASQLQAAASAWSGGTVGGGLGGVVTKPTLAWIGEQGPEAVVPMAKGGTVKGGVWGSLLPALLPLLLFGGMGGRSTRLSFGEIQQKLLHGEADPNTWQTTLPGATSLSPALPGGGGLFGGLFDWLGQLIGFREGGLVPLQTGGVVGGTAASPWGAFGAIAGGAILTELANLLFPPKKPKELPFLESTGPMRIGPGTLDAIIHTPDPLTGVDPGCSIGWSTQADREAYLKPETPSFFESFLKFLLPWAGMLGGAKLGTLGGDWLKGLGGGTMTGFVAPAASPLSTGGALPRLSMSPDLGLPGFQHGGQVARATMALIGEAGPEAVVPLKNNAIPAMLDAWGRLNAVLPTGFKIPTAPEGLHVPGFASGGVVGAPLHVPSFAMGGIVGLPASPPSLVSVAGARGDRGGEGTPGQARPITVNFTVNTPDANSFRASQSQLMAELNLGLRRNARRAL
ncbi:MAG: tape measure protein [Candidatus Entotheonellia bacterium]